LIRDYGTRVLGDRTLDLQQQVVGVFADGLLPEPGGHRRNLSTYFDGPNEQSAQAFQVLTLRLSTDFERECMVTQMNSVFYT